MRRDYKVPLTSIIVFAFIISGFLLFGTIDATQVEPSDCEEQFKRECMSREEAQKLNLICPSPRQPCPLDTRNSRDNNKLEQEDR